MCWRTAELSSPWIEAQFVFKLLLKYGRLTQIVPNQTQITRIQSEQTRLTGPNQ